MYFKKLPFGIKLSYTDSGIAIMTKEFSGNSTGHIRLVVGNGSVHDDLYGLNGVQHVLEHVIFRGVKEAAQSIGPVHLKNHHDIILTVEDRGAEMNGENSYLSVSYTLLFHKSDFDVLSELIMKMVMMPRLDTEDINREKNIVCAELAINKENPLFGDDIDKNYYNERMRELLFSVNPIRNRIGGRDAEVRKITPVMVRDAFGKFYTPNNMALVVAGPFAHHQVTRAVKNFEKKYAHLIPYRQRNGRRLDDSRMQEKNIKGVVKELWLSDHFEHATVNMVYRAPRGRHRDVIPIRMLNGMLGGMGFSKLWEEFRVRRGNAYYADSRYFRTPLHGELRAHVDLEAYPGESYADLIDSVQLFVADEIRKIQHGDINQELFENTKKSLHAYDRKISLEGPEDVAHLLAGCFEEYVFNKDKPIDAIIRDALQEALKIKQCSMKRVVDAANRHLSPDDYVLLVSGPPGCYS